MKNNDKTREQLLKDLEKSKKRIAELEKSEIEYKLVEKKLKSFSSIVEQSTEGIAQADLTGVLLFVNKAWCKMHGYSRSENLIGKNLAIFHNKEQLENDVIPFNKKVKKYGTYSGEVGHIMKDGKPFPTLMTSTLIKDENGNDVSIVGIAKDITESRQVENEMQKLVSVVKYSSELINLSDLNGRMTFLNNSGGIMLGIEPDEVENTNIMDVIPDHLTGLVKKELLPALLKGGIWKGELQYRNLKTGELTDVHAMTFTVKDPYTGQPQFLANLSLDITERKQAGKALKESEQRLRNIFENSTNMFYSHTTDHILTYLSPQVEDMLGYTQEEAKIKWTELASDNPINEIGFQYTVKAIETGERQPPYELELVKKNGEKILVEIREFPYIEDGKTIAIIGSVTDITERKNAEEALKESEQRFRFIAENTGDVLYRLLHYTMTFEYISPAITILTGYTAEEINKKHFISIVEQTVIPGNPDVSFEELEKKWKEGKTSEWRAEYRILSKSGEEKWLGDHSFPWKDDSGKIIGSIGVLQDITERKLAELELAKHRDKLKELVNERTNEVERSQKSLVLLMEDVNEVNLELKNVNTILDATNKELEAFSYSVSHDLRAPLTRMDGFSKALLLNYSGKLDDDGIHYLNRIRASSQHMAKLIDDLLSLSRISREKVTRQKIDMSQTAVRIAIEIEASEPGRNVDFEIRKGLNVNADRKFVIIILENLLGNAFKFTGKKKNAIIELGEKTINEDKVFFIKDNGAGFNMKYCDKIFNAFQRLHSEEEFKGTGIGLAIAQRIINKHGGKIWAESEEGKGATIYFRFE